MGSKLVPNPKFLLERLQIFTKSFWEDPRGFWARLSRGNEEFFVKSVPLWHWKILPAQGCRAQIPADFSPWTHRGFCRIYSWFSLCCR